MYPRIFTTFLLFGAAVAATYYVLGGPETEPFREVAAAAAAVAFAGLASWLLVLFFSRRLKKLRAYSEALARMDTTLPALDFGDDEIGELARSLRGIAPELRNLNESLGTELARREAILTSMIEGVLVVGRDLRISFCNAAFARAIGASAVEARGIPAVNLVRDPVILDLIRHAIDSREPAVARTQLTRGRTFQIQAAPLSSPAENGAVILLHDITEIERLERIRKDFVANVSHELRTPLAAIRGYAETLLNGGLEDVANRRKFAEIIEAHAIRLNNIASDLLALSDLESGNPLPRPSAVPALQCIDSALRAVELEAKMRDVEIIRGRPPDELWVNGYRTRLEQVLINLLDNAVKFNRPGGSVRVDAAPDGRGRARIDVIDTGIGIPSDDLPRVFERFYRVDKARSRDVAGTGLGLSIVKHAVEQMNGQVEVDSALGKGSRFTIFLPLESAPNGSPPET
jgi:two-component system, OmpR family, phosphate regulon sensor histidine kinase PhoR